MADSATQQLSPRKRDKGFLPVRLPLRSRVTRGSVSPYSASVSANSDELARVSPQHSYRHGENGFEGASTEESTLGMVITG